MAKDIERYNESERVNHWVIAITFVLAALSGLAFFHPAFFFNPCGFGPLIDFLSHPTLDFGELRGGVEHEPVAIGMILFRRAILEEMLADDAVNPGTGERDDGNLRG